MGFIKKVIMANLFIEEYDRLSHDAVTSDPPSEDLVPAIRSTGFAKQMRFITILKFTQEFQLTCHLTIESTVIFKRLFLPIMRKTIVSMNLKCNQSLHQ